MQNDKNINIWFDTLRVKHLRVQLPIVQENHYYPYGNLISDICFDNDCNSRELYNTKEMHIQLKLDLYNYGARWYDPQVGRWWTPDPLVEKFYNQSSFSYTMGNPILFSDKLGLYPENPGFMKETWDLIMEDWNGTKEGENSINIHDQDYFSSFSSYSGSGMIDANVEGFIKYKDKSSQFVLGVRFNQKGDNQGTFAMKIGSKGDDQITLSGSIKNKSVDKINFSSGPTIPLWSDKDWGDNGTPVADIPIIQYIKVYAGIYDEAPSEISTPLVAAIKSGQVYFGRMSNIPFKSYFNQGGSLLEVDYGRTFRMKLNMYSPIIIGETVSITSFALDYTEINNIIIHK